MTHATKREIAGWLYLPTMLLAFCVAVGMLLGRAWWGALACYALATALRLTAGAFMNSMGDAATVNAWNNRYHRYVVIALNMVVGVVLWGRVGWDARKQESWYMFAFITAVLATYFLAAHWTRPNTFGARVRSAMLTVVLIMTMAHLAWPWQPDFLWVLMAMQMIGVAWVRLRDLQRRFGWEDR